MMVYVISGVQCGQRQSRELRQVMRATVRRYRQEFRALATSALRGKRSVLPGVSADAVSAAAVSFIYGCGMQAVIDPQHFDVHDVLAVISALTDSKRRTRTRTRTRTER